MGVKIGFELQAVLDKTNDSDWSLYFSLSFALPQYSNDFSPFAADADENSISSSFDALRLLAVLQSLPSRFVITESFLSVLKSASSPSC